MSKTEHGYALCRKGQKIIKGPVVRGGLHEVSIPLRCPPGSELIGVSHHHPGGSLQLSEQDKLTARAKGLEVVCVTAGDKAKCYRFRQR